MKLLPKERPVLLIQIIDYLVQSRFFNTSSLCMTYRLCPESCSCILVTEDIACSSFSLSPMRLLSMISLMLLLRIFLKSLLIIKQFTTRRILSSSILALSRPILMMIKIDHFVEAIMYSTYSP